MMKNYVIEDLSDALEEKYTRFVDMKKDSFMYYSLKYRRFLTELLGDESEYLVAVDSEGGVIGCLPIFFKNDDKIGTVANSFPFYGGHGGVLADCSDVRERLLDEYIRVIKDRNCVASTIVGSPLEDYDALYKDKIQPTFIDERIELMTYFPYIEGVSYADSLMSIYHHMERRCIKKALKNNVTVAVDHSSGAIDFLFDVHTENMLAIGGLPKNRKCFDLITKHFKAGEDYDVYVAKKDDQKIAALLVFYFNGTVEYYTPAIVEQFRTIQPLTLIIYTAMQDAMKKRYLKWNWGGTGLAQKSLYDFKSKWGTTETRYFYYTKIWNKHILEIQKEEIVKRYKNYYVYPFGQVYKNV